MKPLHAAVGALLTACLLAPALAGAAQSTPLETVAAFHAALAAGNTAQASALLAPGVQIYEGGQVERSRAEYAAHHLAADAAFAGATSTTVLRQSERAGAEVAIVMRETETVGRFKGAAVHVLGAETVTLEKTAGGWLINHIHWSSRKPSR